MRVESALDDVASNIRQALPSRAAAAVHQLSWYFLLKSVSGFSPENGPVYTIFILIRRLRCKWLMALVNANHASALGLDGRQ